jgi:hypothetical protein
VSPASGLKQGIRWQVVFGKGVSVGWDPSKCRSHETHGTREGLEGLGAGKVSAIWCPLAELLVVAAN